MPSPPITIAPARSPSEVAAVKALFMDYNSWLGVDLCFQGFEAEMARLPDGYDLLLLATVAGDPAGAVGVRPLEEGVCEMKRLYVPEPFRGLGLGRRLCERLLREAERLGYQLMRLDTLERLTAALALYRDLGFVPCTAYYDNPLDQVIYLERALRPQGPPPS